MNARRHTQTTYYNYPALPRPLSTFRFSSLPAGQAAFGDIAHTTRCPVAIAIAIAVVAVVVLRLKSNKQTNSIAQRRLQVAP